ncbi:MAG: hypothetical protein ABW184_09985 [Sphingobium sp.]
MTGEVWLDPASWVARLNDKLVELDTQYYGFTLIRRMKLDPDEIGNAAIVDTDPQANATLTAARALAAVVSALREIPTFQGNVGLQALTDLGNAMLDLDKGLKPTILLPRPGRPKLRDHSGRRALKAHVVLCIELLELGGITTANAQNSVIKIFSAAGFGGRQKVRKGKSVTGPLPTTTVDGWRLSLARHGEDREGRKIIDRAISAWKSALPWPPREDDVLAFAREKANDPSLRTTI